MKTIFKYMNQFNIGLKKRMIDKLTFQKILKSQFLFLFLLSFVINFLIEASGRHSVLAAYQYLIYQTDVFFYNMALILLSFFSVFLIRKRIFGVVVIGIYWLGIGIVNGVVLAYRITPFTVTDFLLAESAVSIMNKYLNTFQQILLVVGIIVVIALFVLAFIFAPRYQGIFKFKRNIVVFLLSVISFYFITKAALGTGLVSRYFGNVALAYQDYGVPYCFTVTFVDRGIKAPVNYNKNTVRNATNIVQKDAEAPLRIQEGVIVKNPNIIFVQLESFFDPIQIEGLTFSKDPIPTFRKLREEYSSGYLNVPVIGAGTCNTEFEVLTGMNMNFFGPGEYPFKSILTETTCESIAYNLKELGYQAHALHNNSGDFYGRNNIYAQLGFDTFVSIEYMRTVTENPIGWAKDKILTKEILHILEKTEQQDLIYAVSVQAHGNYPRKELDEEPIIRVSGLLDEGDINAYEYYVNQLNEVDEFIYQLVQGVSELKEETMIVFYGDHLPSLGLEKEQLESKSIYKTEYIIWDNFGLTEEDRNLQSYQLSAAVLSQIGIEEGTLIQYHQQNMGGKQYSKNLKLLQYDMLYGRRYLYGGMNPYQRSNLKMGFDDITITIVEQEGENTFIYGENFTEYSRVFIQGDMVDSKCLDEFTIVLLNNIIEEDCIINIGQVGSNDNILSYSKDYIYIVP